MFQAEAIAIEKAAIKMESIIQRDEKYIRIFSDSQAVLKALDKEIITSKTVLGARIALNQLKEKVQALTLHWIKAQRS